MHNHIVRRWYFLTFVQNFVLFITDFGHDGNYATVVQKIQEYSVLP